MKRNYLLLMLLLFAGTSLFSQTRLYLVGDFIDSYTTGISPNGEYVVGNIELAGFLWTVADSSLIILSDGTESYANAVANDGTVAGQFLDSLVSFEGQPSVSGGYYRNGMWHSLGVLPDFEPTSVYDGSSPYAISADGNTVAGQAWVAPGGMVAPIVWRDGEYSEVLDGPETGQGANVWTMSSDASLFAGWTAPEWSRTPIVWVDGVETPILENGNPGTGESMGVSGNALYAALTFNGIGAIYNVETEDLTFTGKLSDTDFGSSCTDVSDDGFAIGYSQITMAYDREAFIYSDMLGLMAFDDFVEKYLPDLDVPAGFSFNTPTGISSDGLVICGIGFSNNVRVGWILKLDAPIETCSRPNNLIAEVMDRNTVILTWEAPALRDATVEGYNIFRDGNQVNETLVTDLTFTETGVPSGHPKYSVSAVWSDGCESNPSDKLMVTIVDNYDIPFIEDFASNDLNTNFWTANPSDSWIVYTTEGLAPPAVVFMGFQNNFSSFLLSKNLDATELTEVELSFNLQFTLWGVGMMEQMFVEVYNGTEWVSVKTYDNTNGSISWLSETVDISVEAAGKMTQIRFRAECEAAYQGIWIIDNIKVDVPGNSSTCDVPMYLSAIGKADHSSVDLRWANPQGEIILTYVGEYIGPTIGNEGVTFIAANQFDIWDLNAYEGFNMTQLKFYPTHQGTGSEAIFTLVIYENDQLVYSQPFTNATMNNWNIITLDTPYAIDATKILRFGLQIEHSADDAPILIDYGPGVTGKGDIYSEDGGLSWNTLESQGFYGSWAISGIVINPIAQSKVNLEGDIVGYGIYRDGVQVNTYLNTQTFFTDYYSFDFERPCYTIKALYDGGCISDLSEPVCMLVTNVGQIDENSVKLYPNPASSVINIEGGEYSKISLVDIMGHVIFESAKSVNSINVSNLIDGVYILRLENNHGLFTKKVVVRK